MDGQHLTEKKTSGHPETWVFDVLESKWSVCVVPPSSSITTKKVSIILA